MKAILKFDLEEPDDRESMLRCLKSLSMAIALEEIREVFRRELKHGNHSGKAHNLLSTLNDGFWEMLEDGGINLDEMLS